MSKATEHETVDNTTPEIRDYEPADKDQVLALNLACVPEVGDMDDDKLAGFVEWAPYFRVVDIGAADDSTSASSNDSQIVGLLVGLTEEAPYGSPNFGWFTKRYSAFAYIDRIAISESQRGMGWGPALYNDFERWARSAQRPMLCAEVNVEPPNQRSVRFHELFGFDLLEEVEPTGSPDYRVVMVAKTLD